MLREHRQQARLVTLSHGMAGKRRRRAGGLAGLASILAVTASMIDARAAAVMPRSGADFCARAQRLIASTDLMPVNLAFAAPAGFVKSKPRIRPLETDQHLTYEEAGRTRPVRVSCKMKSADHIRAEYGSGAAGAGRDCRAVNEDTVARVFASLTEAEEARVIIPRDRILLAEDRQALTGAAFTAGRDVVRMSPDGRLVIRALAIRVDWTDWRWRWMPERFRGQHSCHLVAPEYLRRIVLGQAVPVD
jgi:hypothetical protein